MFIECFTLLLLAHFIGDFYVQPARMAKAKQESAQMVLLHGGIYGAAVMIVLLPVMSKTIFVFALLVILSHILIDASKYTFVKKTGAEKTADPIMDRNIFFCDQAMHILVLAIAATGFVFMQKELLLLEQVEAICRIIGIPFQICISWITAILAIHKPANLAIAKLLMPYKQENDAETKEKDRNAGRFIGTLERGIVLILLSMDQYAAIGLVLTAKSIARYDRISKEPAFAEYYLMGTLLSSLAAIIISFLL